MPKTYVTFGFDHNHEVNGVKFNANTVAIINCENSIDGRRKAFKHFGPEFAFEYHEEEFDMESMKFYKQGFRNLKESPPEDPSLPSLPPSPPPTKKEESS